MNRRLIVAATLALGFVAGCVGPESAIPECEAGGRLTILAQAVPSAAMVPCIAEMPVGWSFASLDVENGIARFWLDSDRAGLRAVEVTLSARCATGGTTAVDSDEEGARRLQRLDTLAPRFVGTTYDVFEGGCVSYRYELTSGPHIGLHEELHDAVSLFPRRDLLADLSDDLGVDLSDDRDDGDEP